KYTAILATGYDVTPHFAYKVGNKEIKFKSKNVFDKRDNKYLHSIRKAMYEVANSPHGTATKYLKDCNVTLAAKTGTAQVVGIPQEEKKRMKENELAYYKRSQAWLTTYGPYKNPQYVVTVLVEHGGHGGSAAGGIVSQIFDKLLELGYIKK
ncbi:MAG: penicillin-binding protein 2, partial [Epsilonproteobacteria bacterium]|nr:penicillin-binding protein 2 [Campylobacterota bacterium]